MKLSPEEIKKLQEAREELGSTVLIEAAIETQGLDPDNIQAMIAEHGPDRAFDLIFGIESQPEAKAGKDQRASIAVALPKDLQRVTTAEQLSTSVRQMATTRKLPPELLLAIIRHESNFDPLARSSAGAVGLMQLMPDAAKQSGLSISKSKDEREEPMRNIQAGLDYLSWLRETYNIRTVEDLLGAYNAGPGRLKDRKYKTIKETRDYISRVKETMASYKKDPQGLNKDLKKLHSAVNVMALKKGDI